MMGRMMGRLMGASGAGGSLRPGSILPLTGDIDKLLHREMT